jgi:hypothetical protein
MSRYEPYLALFDDAVISHPSEEPIDPPDVTA